MYGNVQRNQLKQKGMTYYTAPPFYASRSYLCLSVFICG